MTCPICHDTGHVIVHPPYLPLLSGRHGRRKWDEIYVDACSECAARAESEYQTVDRTKKDNVVHLKVLAR